MKSSEVSFHSGIAGLVLVLVGLELGLDVKNVDVKNYKGKKDYVLSTSIQ